MEAKTVAAPFIVVDVSGPGYERGVQYGRQAGSRIARGVETYRAGFAASGLEWAEAMSLARSFLDRIGPYDADMAAELRGIARGAEQPQEAIVALNARIELLYWKAAKNPGAEPLVLKDTGDDCTGVVALPEATADGQVLHGQNWDWRIECAESALLLRIHATQGPDILTFVEAGQLARNGMNSAGIALTANGLHSDHDGARCGVPSPLIRRRILQSTTLAGAIDVVMNSPRSYSHNLMISHAGGLAIDLETTPDEVFWIKPERGLLIHANHFKSASALARVRDVGLRRSPDSLHRDTRVEQILEPRRGSIGLEDLKAALADTYGAPLGVCGSPVTERDGTTTATLATILMDPSAGRMWAAPAPYHGEPVFTAYSLA